MMNGYVRSRYYVMVKIGLILNVGKVNKSIKLPHHKLIRYRNCAR